MIEKGWKTLAGDPIDLRSALEAEAREYPDATVVIASDSQQIKTFTEFVTVVVVHRPSKGGRVFFCREKVPRVKVLKERLWKEVWRSTELAMELTESPDIGERQAIDVQEIHIDANVDPRFESTRYVEELVGLVVGQGFRAVVKPDAWAASHAADHAVKHRDERPRGFIKRRGRRRRVA